MNNILRHIALTIAAIALTACAAPRVHLFSAGVTQDEAQRIRAALESAGYVVAPSRLPVPDDIIGPTLVYSPQSSSIRQVERLDDLLMELGYAVNLATAGVGNHFYTKGNLGLYLQAAASSPSSEDALADRTYNGQCKDLDAYLHFSSGRFRFEIIDWDEEEGRELVTEKSGLWERRKNTVILYLEEEHVDLFLTPVRYTTQYSTISGIRLVNDSDSLQGCSFEYREVMPL